MQSHSGAQGWYWVVTSAELQLWALPDSWSVWQCDQQSSHCIVSNSAYCALGCRCRRLSLWSLRSVNFSVLFFCLLCSVYSNICVMAAQHDLQLLMTQTSVSIHVVFGCVARSSCTFSLLLSDWSSSHLAFSTSPVFLFLIPLLLGRLHYQASPFFSCLKLPRNASWHMWHHHLINASIWWAHCATADVFVCLA